MRRISGLTAAAVACPSWPSGSSRPGAARPPPLENEVERAYDVVGVITDADGTTHARMVRTYGGLPVIGGDRVVHRARRGAVRGVSQTLEAPLSLGDRRRRPPPRLPGAGRGAGRPGDRRRAAESSRLVVDATSGTGRLAWEVVSGGTQADGTPSRLATYVDARTGKVLWREQQIETADGLRAVALLAARCRSS